jgi:hypothetical protein
MGVDEAGQHAGAGRIELDGALEQLDGRAELRLAAHPDDAPVARRQGAVAQHAETVVVGHGGRAGRRDSRRGERHELAHAAHDEVGRHPWVAGPAAAPLGVEARGRRTLAHDPAMGTSTPSSAAAAMASG